MVRYESSTGIVFRGFRPAPVRTPSHAHSRTAVTDHRTESVLFGLVVALVTVAVRVSLELGLTVAVVSPLMEMTGRGSLRTVMEVLACNKRHGGERKREKPASSVSAHTRIRYKFSQTPSQICKNMPSSP